MTVVGPAAERLVCPADLEEVVAGEILEAATPGRFSRVVRHCVLAYNRRADANEGVWGERPAGLTVMRGFIAGRCDAYSAAITGWWEKGYGGFSLMACGVLYGGLWAIRRPLCIPADGGGPPSLGVIRAHIRSRGTCAKVYGYALVGWTHLLGYGLAHVLQRPARFALAGAIIWFFHWKGVL